MAVVYQSSREIDASLIAHQLVHNKIDAVVLGGTLAIAAGEIQTNDLFRVEVANQHAERARLLIEEWDHVDSAIDDDTDVILASLIAANPVDDAAQTSVTLPRSTIALLTAVLIAIIVLWIVLSAM